VELSPGFLDFIFLTVNYRPTRVQLLNCRFWAPCHKLSGIYTYDNRGSRALRQSDGWRWSRGWSLFEEPPTAPPRGRPRLTATLQTQPSSPVLLFVFTKQQGEHYMATCKRGTTITKQDMAWRLALIHYYRMVWQDTNTLCTVNVYIVSCRWQTYREAYR